MILGAKGLAVLATLLGCGQPSGLAQEAGVPPDSPLQMLLNTPVEVASKGLAQKVSMAPAIVSVITREDIRALGYRSVAEALRSVPGLYVIHDRVAPNLGVRGINGGSRAYSRILKVMINAQPVDFRSDTTNFLGPELLPMEIIDRIEVVLGPASSLYGANAFLGVVNILTRKPLWNGGTALLRSSFLSGDRDRGGEGALTRSWSAGGFLVAASASETDRSGATLPESSPLLLAQPDLRDVASRNEKSHPRSAFISGWWKQGEALRWDLMAHFSRLDTIGEFLDFGTLSSRNRIQVDNGFGRLKADWAPGRRFTLSASLAYAEGGPGAQERLDSGSTSTHPRRDVGYSGWDALVEGRMLFRGNDSLTVGLDHGAESQKLMTVYTVNDATGAESADTAPRGRKAFSNLGAFVQYIAYPWDDLGITLNVRHDRHTIYGGQTTHRVGLVYHFQGGLFGKLLYGTSFKAPSAIQLYAQPLFGGEVRGNPDLKPERAHTLEAALGWTASDWMATFNLFKNTVRDQVVLLPSGINQVPTNTGLQNSHGAEGQVQVLLGRHSLKGALAFQKTDVHTPDPFLGERVTPTSMYPSLTAHLRWELRYGMEGVMGAEAHFASERRATRSNILENAMRPYTLKSYTLVDAFWSHRLWVSMKGTLRLQARINNLLDQGYAEPGFRGADVPGTGRELVATLGFQF